MIQSFFYHLGHNLSKQRTETVQVLLALFGAMLVVWWLLHAMFWTGIFGLILAAPIVLGASLFLPKLAWFWGPLARVSLPPEKPAPKTPDTTAPAEATETFRSTRSTASKPEADITDDGGADGDQRASGALNPDETSPLAYLREERPLQDLGSVFVSVRNTPKGAMLGRANSKEAVLDVKVARELWWWLAPAIAGALFFPLSIVGVPLTLSWRESDQVLGYLLIGLGVILLIAAFVYGRTWLRIHIQKDRISVGNKVFDRRHANGFSTGYSIEGNSTEGILKADFSDKSFGLSGLRIRYGRWGEDLPYLLNGYHAAEIVVWMNEIIDSVGAPPPPSYDPYAGHKVELL